jgi:hypothetical protein
LLDRIPNAIQTAVPQMRRIAVARVETGVAEGVLSVDVITENGLSPDYLYLYGNYTSADSYPSRGFDSGDAFIVLEPTSDELVRGGYIDGASNAQAVLDSLFPAGRLLRVFDPSTGEEQYGLIAGTTATTGAPRVDLNGTVPFAWRDSQPTCGLRGSSSGVRLNTVNIIRYGIADLMGDANYAFLDDGLDFNADRLEFVREEIDPTAEDSVLDGGGGVIAGTTELVAEFAVDFRVDIVAQTSPETAMAPVTTTFIPSATGAFANFAGDPTDVAQAAGVGRGPHLIRALRPRLSVRERIPTKEADLDASAGPGLFRIPLTDLTTTPREYAKVRTLSSYVMTRNARNAQW